MTRRFYALVATVAVLVAGGVATVLTLELGGSTGRRELTPSAYLARVAAVCDRYGRQLDRIAPPSDIAAYGEVASSVGRALPVLRQQTAAIRAIRPPAELRARVERFMALTDRSLVELQATLSAAQRRDLGAMGQGLIRFSLVRDQAKVLAAGIGFRCS